MVCALMTNQQSSKPAAHSRLDWKLDVRSFSLLDPKYEHRTLNVQLPLRNAGDSRDGVLLYSGSCRKSDLSRPKQSTCGRLASRVSKARVTLPS